MKNEDQIQLEAATYRRLVKHLQENTDLQNIDLMNLAGFCRNCLSKWMTEEAKLLDIKIDYEESRNKVYGMSLLFMERKISKTDKIKI